MPIIFKENLIDILEDWNFYPLKDPCSEDPAFNAGHVQVKCYINNICPFYKTPKKEDGLVFNWLTVAGIQESLPEEIKSVLTTTQGVEGMHFEPIQIFRHNYIYQFDPTSLQEQLINIFRYMRNTFSRKIQ